MSQRARLTKAKIAIIGSQNVGKSALAVRYLTKRFIGEYDTNKEMKYTHKVQCDRDEITLEILDTANENNEGLEGHIQWADGFILMYSVTNRDSYERLQLYGNLIKNIRKSDVWTPVVIVANKVDLLGARQVSEAEGCGLARRYDCPVYEISVAESTDGVMDTFNEILRQIRREFVRMQVNAVEKRSTLNSVKRVFQKKIYRSKSDTM